MQVNSWFIGRSSLRLNALLLPSAWRRLAVPVGARCWVLLLCLWPLATLAAEPAPMSSAERAVLNAINQYRSEQGRTPWQANNALAQVARSHSQAMAAQGRLSHDGFQRRAAGTGSDLCVENLLRGQVAPARAVQLWMKSLAHHDNLLEPAARFAGIGLSGPFVTLLACASPPGAAGSPENVRTEPGQR